MKSQERTGKNEKDITIDLSPSEFVKIYGAFPVKSSGDRYIDQLATHKGFAVLNPELESSLGELPNVEDILDNVSSNHIFSGDTQNYTSLSYNRENYHKSGKEIKELGPTSLSPLESGISSGIDLSQLSAPNYNRLQNYQMPFSKSPSSSYRNFPINYNGLENTLYQSPIGSRPSLNMIEMSGRRSGMGYYSNKRYG